MSSSYAECQNLLQNFQKRHFFGIFLNITPFFDYVLLQITLLEDLKKKLTLEKAKIVCSKTDIQIAEKAQYKTLKVVYNNYMTT